MFASSTSGSPNGLKASRTSLTPTSPSAAEASWRSAPFCIQRIRRTKQRAKGEGGDIKDEKYERSLDPACVNACPTETLFFGDLNDPESKVSKIRDKESQEGGRAYRLLENLGTNPNVIYLKKVDKSGKVVSHD